MYQMNRRTDDHLKRRLSKWQIFFIGVGGVIGIGFFRGSSKMLGVAGPGGALIAVIVVGIIGMMVMDSICEMITMWPIPNAMVEFVRAFVDEDLASVIGIMYWYTYCVTFSALVIAAGDLTDYWGVSFTFKALIYAIVPFILLLINAAPVQIFGWIELLGGVVKIALVFATVVIMFVLNAGGMQASGQPSIGSKYFEDAVENNPNVAANHATSVLTALPLATFAYIGIELLTTTAFEARDPHELRLPARHIGWFIFVLYSVATGAFVANVSWQDQNLPLLFQQALTPITDSSLELDQFSQTSGHVTHAAPLIALIRCGLIFLPSFLNGCFIYSALSCANTALYVASRQLYGLTRTISTQGSRNPVRRILSWMSGVDPTTKAPWPALLVSVTILFWLPFVRLHHDTLFLEKVQDSLINIGSVSCVLVWCSQCIAYIKFAHWRNLHKSELEREHGRWEKLFQPENFGIMKVLQPGIAYIGAVATLLIVFFFNTVSLWNGKVLDLKAPSTFVSPALLLLLWMVKKALRWRKQQGFFVDLSDVSKFKQELERLDELIYPGEMPSPKGMVMDLAPVMSDDNNASGRGRRSDLHDTAINTHEPYNRGDLILPQGTEPVGHGVSPTSPATPSAGIHAQVPTSHELNNMSRVYSRESDVYPTINERSTSELYQPIQTNMLHEQWQSNGRPYPNQRQLSDSSQESYRYTAYSPVTDPRNSRVEGEMSEMQ